MKKSVAIVLCLALVLSLCLCGCANEKKQVLGTWTGTIDLTDKMNEEMLDGDAEMAEYVSIDSFNMELTLCFNEDDTYSMTVNEAALQEELDNMIGVVVDGMMRYMVDVLAAEGLELTVEEVMEMTGITEEALYAEISSGIDLSEVIGEVNMEGQFKVADGKLYMSDALDHLVDESMYELYTVEGNTLTIDKGNDTDDSNDFVYPMVFNKAA